METPQSLIEATQQREGSAFSHISSLVSRAFPQGRLHSNVIIVILLSMLQGTINAQ